MLSFQGLPKVCKNVCVKCTKSTRNDNSFMKIGYQITWYRVIEPRSVTQLDQLLSRPEIQAVNQAPLNRQFENEGYGENLDNNMQIVIGVIAPYQISTVQGNLTNETCSIFVYTCTVVHTSYSIVQALLRRSRYLQCRNIVGYSVGC